MLIIFSVAISGYVLAATIWDSMKTDNNKLVAFAAIAAVLILHLSLSMCLKVSLCTRTRVLAASVVEQTSAELV